MLGALAATQLGFLNALAVGFRLPNQDPEAIARGNAFVATADNASAIYYNPAGITQLKGQTFQAGLYMISANTDFTSVTGAKASTRGDFQPVPQLHYVLSPKDSPFSYGLGIYSPYGLGLDWGNNAPFRVLAEKGSLLYGTVNPVIAWRINSTLSLAIGPTINYSDATFKRGIGLLPGDQFQFKGSGLDFGFNAGVLWQPRSEWSFGVNYRYATTVDYSGDSKTTPSPPLPASSSTHASIRFPQFVVTGVSYRPTEKWNFECDVDWTDWDNLNQLVLRGTAFGNVPLELNYRSSLMYEFGVTRKLENGYFVSTGYIYSENSSPDQNFSPLIPDSNLHLGSFGFGHRGQRWDWAAGYHFAYSAGREVRSNPVSVADGTYRTFNHAFDLSVTFKF